MKTTFLLLLAICTTGMYAQTFLSSPFELPVTGFDLLKQENNYLLTQTRSNSSSPWVNNLLFIQKKAANVNFNALDRKATWSNNTWIDNELTTDSFILDNQNRISVVFETVKYVYPGYNYQAKQKFLLSYNSDNRLYKIIFQEAVPVTSNNYKTGLDYIIKYDNDGKRICDSIYLYANKMSYKQTYIYNSTNLITHEYGIEGTDTTQEVVYNYDQTLLKSAITQSFDQTADQWAISQADSFEYNSKNEIVQHIKWRSIRNNGNTTFEPFAKEKYTYHSTNKLSEIIEMIYENKLWKNDVKSIFSYNNQGKIQTGFSYKALSNTEWETFASTQYLFEESTTGINTINKPNSQTFSVYPNPATEQINIPNNTHANILIYNTIGKVVLQANTNTDKLDVSSLNNGTYYIQIINTENQTTFNSQFIINR
jgi:hypothetical protein